MSKKSIQSSFLGGFWSEEAHGRFEDARYKTALAECLNATISQEGYWGRRPGLRHGALTRDGKPGKLLELAVNAAPSHSIELTDGHLRLHNGAHLLTDDGRQTVTVISGAKPAVVTTETAHGWSSDDRVFFRIDGINGAAPSDLAPLLNREIVINVLSDTTFSIYADGMPIDGADLTFSTTTMQLSVARVTDLETPYEFGNWKNVNSTQDDEQAILLNGAYPPQVLAIADKTQPFSIKEADFIDGPYLDPIDGVVVVMDPVSPLSGVVNISFSYKAWDSTKAYPKDTFVGIPGTSFGFQSLTDLNLGNDPASSPTFWKPITTLNGFANLGGGLTEADYGRHIRLLSEPEDWAADTDYEIDTNVSFGVGSDRTYYTAIAAITGVPDVAGKTNPLQPGFDATKWVPNPSAARWTWGKLCPPQPHSIPVTPHWYVPGFTLDLDCGRLVDGQPVAPYTYVTHPTSWGIQSCAWPGTRNDYVLGTDHNLVGTDVEVAAADAESYTIAVSTLLPGIFNQLNWPTALHFTRNPGYVGAPADPVWITSSLSADALDGLPGKPFGNLSQGAGVNALFLQSTTDRYSSNPGFSGFAGIRLEEVGVISQGRCYPLNETDVYPFGFSPNAITKSVVVRLRARSDGVEPSTASDGTLIGETRVQGPITSNAPVVVASTDTTTAWSHVWFEILVELASDETGDLTAYGGSFRYPDFTTFQVAASRMSFYSDANIPAGTSIGVQILGDPLLYNGTIPSWRLGRYNKHLPTFPTVGCFAEGRLWLASDDNHFDASSSFGILNFAPTFPDGTVSDGNAISETIASDSKNTINWMVADERGVLVGTASREWLIASGTGGAIAPADIKVDPVGGFGSSPVVPIVTPLTTVFVHKNSRNLHELMRDAYSGQLVAPTMQEFAQSLTFGGVKELAFQHSLTPVVWAYTGEGELIGTSYRRDHHFSWQPPAFNAWHHHQHGDEARKFISLSANTSLTGNLDTISVITEDEAGVCRVEVLDEPFPTGGNIYNTNNLDGSLVPHSGHYETDGVTLYGLWALNNKMVTVLLAGLDCGELPVVDGATFVPYNDKLTRLYIEQVAALEQDFGTLAMSIDGLATVPCLVGFTYDSIGQRLRPMEDMDNTAALGVLRRNDHFAMLVVASGGLSIGTDDELFPLNLDRPDGTPISDTELKSGVITGTLEDDSSTDGMIRWEVTRPKPALVLALGGFLELTGVKE